MFSLGFVLRMRYMDSAQHSPNGNHWWWLGPHPGSSTPPFWLHDRTSILKIFLPLQPCVLGWNSTRTHQIAGLRVTWQRSVLFKPIRSPPQSQNITTDTLAVDYCFVYSPLSHWQNQPTHHLNVSWAFLYLLGISFPALFLYSFRLETKVKLGFFHKLFLTEPKEISSLYSEAFTVNHVHPLPGLGICLYPPLRPLLCHCSALLFISLVTA